MNSLSPDGRILFATRIVRLFGYGLLSVVLVLYLAAVGLTDREIGMLLTLTLVGDTVVSLWLTTGADRFGRKRTLLIGALLVFGAGIAFALSRNFWVLLLAATIGVVSPSGGEVGPFLPVEQASLSEAISSTTRTTVFAWYNLVGSFATACGALIGGFLCKALLSAGHSAEESYRYPVFGYAAGGLVLALLFSRLSSAAETRIGREEGTKPEGLLLGLHRSKGVVLRLSALFALDSFAGGFVLQSVVAYWFHRRFGASVEALGGIFFGANVLAGLSSLVAARLAAKIGLVNTMVFTHLPSNVLLMLVPLMPTQGLAALLLLLRFSVSQMDVPARQSYVMHVVDPDERSAAAGVTSVARSVGASIAPALALPLLALPSLMYAPFVIAGGLKVVYDLLLYKRFRETES